MWKYPEQMSYRMKKNLRFRMKIKITILQFIIIMYASLCIFIINVPPTVSEFSSTH